MKEQASFEKKWTFVLVLIIIFYLINGITYLHSQSTTFDEPSFYNYAVRLLKGRPDRIHPSSDNSKMPISILNVIPRGIEQLLYPGLVRNDWGKFDILIGRHVTLFVSILTILLVFQWSFELYGIKAGLFSAFLFSFCPNNLAHAALVTTDAYATLFLLSTTYFLWKYCNSGRFIYFLLLSIFVALSQLVKQSLFHLYLLVPFCLFVSFFKISKVKARAYVVRNIFIFIIINWAIINAGFYFYETNTVLGSYHFSSSLFQQVQQLFPDWLPLPLPQPFITGLDQAKFYDQLGGGYPNSSFSNVTVLGQSSTGGSFWYYYLVLIILKTPISYLLFLSAAIIIGVKKNSNFWRHELFLLLPVIYFIILMSFFYNTQCGLRHLIFIYPFFFIFSGSIIPVIYSRQQKAFVLITSIFLIVSVLSYWKNYIPYTNELIRDKKTAYKYVGAGGLVFGHAGYFLQEFLKKNPDLKPAPSLPATGRFYLSVDRYLDTWNLHHWDWLKAHEPSSHISHSYLVFDIK